MPISRSLLQTLLVTTVAVSVVACGDDDPSPTGGDGAGAPAACTGLPDTCEGRAATELLSASVSLGVKVTAMGELVALSCQNAAVHFGDDPNAIPQAGTLDERLGWCARAQARLQGMAPTISVSSLCQIDLAAQAACEKTCNASSCTLEDLADAQARCDQGDELSGTCPANCVGACWPAAGDTLDCNDVCYGTCVGQCDGMPSSGVCTGNCQGTCDGACDAPGQALVTCEGTATCQGACSVELEDAGCSDAIVAIDPTCATCPSCQAVCSAAGAFGTACRASVAVIGVPAADAAALRTILEVRLATEEEAERLTTGLSFIAGSSLGGTSGATAECVQFSAESIATSSERLSAVLAALAAIQL